MRIPRAGSSHGSSVRQTGAVGPCITSPRRPETCVAAAPPNENIGVATATRPTAAKPTAQNCNAGQLRVEGRTGRVGSPQISCSRLQGRQTMHEPSAAGRHGLRLVGALALLTGLLAIVLCAGAAARGSA